MLVRQLAPWLEVIFAVLRVTAGLMFAFHGATKVFGVLTTMVPPVGSQIWIGGIIELTTGLLMAVGYQTNWAAFLASGTMAVAYVQFHWRFDLGPRFFPTVNQGELALLYSVLFLFIAAHGGGRHSLDGRRGTGG
ncbi:MAG: DoxX family protein [Polyangiaceae bacterium]|nr:DoxX family protein [Polyangiaceae bacterium]